jgi:hypothetical protein
VNLADSNIPPTLRIDNASRCTFLRSILDVISGYPLTVIAEPAVAEVSGTT